MLIGGGSERPQVGLLANEDRGRGDCPRLVLGWGKRMSERVAIILM